MNGIRAFVAIDIPENIRKEIINIQQTLPKFKGKITEPENLHLTLKFLGNVDLSQIFLIKKKLGNVNVKTFTSEIKEIGIFGNRKSGKYSQQIIVWLYLTNINELQNKVDEALSSLFEGEKRFMSHLTIARVKGIGNKKRFLNGIKRIEIASGLSFEVESFQLKKSELTAKGSVYENLETYPLKK